MQIIWHEFRLLIELVSSLCYIISFPEYCNSNGLSAS